MTDLRDSDREDFVVHVLGHKLRHRQLEEKTAASKILKTYTQKQEKRKEKKGWGVDECGSVRASLFKATITTFSPTSEPPSPPLAQLQSHHHHL